MNAATVYAVPVEHLQTVLVAHKLRRYSDRALSSFAAMTAAPTVEVDCSSGRTPSEKMRATAMKLQGVPRVQPLQRGWIGRVFNRTQARSKQEVKRTWNTTISALRHEPQYSLQLPLLAKGAA